MSQPQPPTPPRPVQPPTPLQTLSTDLITLDGEIGNILGLDVESPHFHREVYRGYTPQVLSALNTPEVPPLSPEDQTTFPSSPPRLDSVPSQQALRITPRAMTPVEPLDLSAKPTRLPSPYIPSPLSTSAPEPREYLAAVMDSHRDRALKSTNFVRLVSSECTMEITEEDGFRYFRLITIINGQ